MSKDGKKDGKTLKRIKTGALERQWQVARAGVTAGGMATTQMWGSLFLPRDKRRARNSRILSRQAQYLADELGQLKGSVVKIGQMIALYGENLLPAEITQALRTLEEKTVALEWPLIESTLQSELGERFQDFVIEQTPIGAASLAQVHRAVHQASGDQVCLKVQYPGVAQSIDSDFDSVVKLLKLSRLLKTDQPLDEWLDEIRQLLHYEVDYQREAEMTRRFRARLLNDPIFTVPEVYDDYCTPRLLVTSYESGVAVSHETVAAIAQAQRNCLACAFLQLFLREVFEWGELQTDPNFGNYRIRLADNGHAEIALLDFGSVLPYRDDFLQAVKAMVLGAYLRDEKRIREGAIALGIMRPEYPENVHEDFAELCYLLLEPFTDQRKLSPDLQNANGEYRWAHSQLPKRAAKHAARSAISKYFAIPPREFAFLSRKLLGVYSFIATLDAEFNPGDMLDQYLDA